MEAETRVRFSHPDLLAASNTASPEAPQRTEAASERERSDWGSILAPGPRLLTAEFNTFDSGFSLLPLASHTTPHWINEQV